MKGGESTYLIIMHLKSFKFLIQAASGGRTVILDPSDLAWWYSVGQGDRPTFFNHTKQPLKLKPQLAKLNSCLIIDHNGRVVSISGFWGALHRGRSNLASERTGARVSPFLPLYSALGHRVKAPVLAGYGLPRVDQQLIVRLVFGLSQDKGEELTFTMGACIAGFRIQIHPGCKSRASLLSYTVNPTSDGN